jgi:predicted extracellular nuclease
MKISFLLLLIVTTTFSLFGETNDEKEYFRVMSYNTENYMDYRHDSLSAVSEFSPTGMRAWNSSRYRQKRDKIAKVIVAVGEWNPPALVALCEIENQAVLEDLTLRSPLRNLNYQISHFESPDPRGIDVALLYQPKQFKPYHQAPITIHFTNSPHQRTRDILYVAGTLRNNDTLHVFVNHFPSRLGGELESENSRIAVATVLRQKVDSLFQDNPHANILIMGDFNDYPDNFSVNETLRALSERTLTETPSLYNLFYTTHKEGEIGSYKHNGQWGMLDQIIASSHLFNGGGHTYINPGSAQVFAPDFLLEEDESGFGKRPFRTYVGIKYHEGFSDHLPVYVDLVIQK